VTGDIRPCDGLIAGLEAVARDMRAFGLEVDVEVARGVPADSGVPGAAGGPPAAAAPVVPVPVAGAIAQAVHEALANVAAHAGTTVAWVTVSLTSAGDGAAGPASLQVEVRDAGVGFDPDRVDPARLGLRRSIVERIADWGGAASIQSAPGQGTVVSLCWPAAGPAAGLTSSPGEAGLREAAPW
jgi:signal transduction histidine kinase